MSLNELADRDLMRRVARGDAGAFSVLHRRYRAHALHIAIEITHDASSAEEVVQDAFLSVWKGAGRYDPNRGSLGTWLGAIVRNRAIDALRRNTRHERNLSLEDSSADELPSAAHQESDLVQALDARRVRMLLGELPHEQREVVFLGFYAGLSQPEIATRIRRPLGTVKSRQRLALAKLHAPLAKLYAPLATLDGPVAALQGSASALEGAASTLEGTGDRGLAVAA